MGTHPSPLLHGPPSDPVCRSLLDSLGEACVALDPDGRVLYCNPAYGALVGVAAADLIGRPLTAAVPGFAGSPCDRACGRALESGVPQEAEEARAGRFFRCRAHPAPEGVVVLITDVTARRRFEEELDRAWEEERRLQEQSFQARKLESLGLLAGGLAHDFNNLLVGMLTAADLLRRDLPPGGESHSLAELIKKAAERAANLSRQMLLYAGKGAPARRPLGLNAAVEEALALMAPALPKAVAVATALAPGLPPVEADPGQVRQVVTNLVLNAAEAVGPKGGRVTLATGVEEKDEGGRRKEEGAARPVHPSSFLLPPSDLAAGRYVYLQVTDDGCGMAPDVLARAFDPFFTTKGKGRGLGLSSVQGIVRCHGGGLHTRSAPGAGTTVRVLLPAATAGARPGAAPPAEPPPPSRGEVVLLIDDEPVVRDVITRALGHVGLQVLSAGGSREGLELFRARRESIRLVLLDLGMPEQDGLQTLAALRAERPDVRVVLTSGSGPDHALGQAGPGPPVAFLPKPYTVPVLLDVVNRELKRGAPDEGPDPLRGKGLIC